LLVDTLQNRRLSSSLLQQKSVTNTIRRPAEGLSSDFQIAYQQVEANATRLAFDIEKLDAVLNLGSHGSLCIVGEPKYAQLLMDRLCVHTMLPKRHGGIGEGYSQIIAIDAGNCSDAYQIVNFARQYGLEVKKVLQNITVGRVFTIYQLAHLIIHELPRIIEEVSSDRRANVIAIYGLLHLFVSDPHIDKVDAKKLTKEIGASIRKISEDRFVVVATTPCNHEYQRFLVSVFENTTWITNDNENSKVLKANVRYKSHHIRGEGNQPSTFTKFSMEDLSLIPSR
jgi:hypothetical protein